MSDGHNAATSRSRCQMKFAGGGQCTERATELVEIDHPEIDDADSYYCDEHAKLVGRANCAKVVE